MVAGAVHHLLTELAGPDVEQDADGSVRVVWHDQVGKLIVVQIADRQLPTDSGFPTR